MANVYSATRGCRLGRLEGLHVLLVEDNRDARELLCFVLEREGARVECVESAATALEAIASEPPDVLLSDVSMPGMSGYALMRRIRQLPPEAGGQVPAAAISAHASASSREQSLEAGFQAHVTKPLDPETLVTTVLSLASRSPVAGS
jgi:CheY-like chemotaxis protein